MERLALEPFFFPMCLSVTGDKLQVFSLAAHHQNHSLANNRDRPISYRSVVSFFLLLFISLHYVFFYGLNVGMVSYDAKIT